MAGIARTAIKTGNVSRGYAIATEIQDKDAVNEIAFSCEQMKQFDEAATLYEKGQNLTDLLHSIFLPKEAFRNPRGLSPRDVP